MFDLVIIGGGPAGVAAGIYAARKRLKTLLITESFGGQSIDSMGIENWIGIVKISGPEFAKILEMHLRAYASDVLVIKTPEKALKIDKIDDHFAIETDKGKYESKTVLLTTGSLRRKLEIPGAKEYENKGITYCASCDGPLFAGQDVAVIGGGNAAFETAAQLLAYAKAVTLLTRGEFKADEMTVEEVLKHPNMKALKNVNLKEIRGDKFVNSLVYEENGEDKELPVTGVFVEIGLMPATMISNGVVNLNNHNQIIIDPKTQRTTTLGIWAAGDATDTLYHQNNIAAGDAVRALEDIYLFLRTGRK